MNRLSRLLAGLTGLLIASQSHITFAQPAQHQAANIRRAAEQYDTAQAEKLLRSALERNPRAFAANNYDYLLARVLTRRGQPAEALRVFDQVATRKSILGGYALWHAAEIARESRDFDGERLRLARLLREYPSFLHRSAVTQRLGASYLASKKYTEVVTILSPAAGTRGSSARENLARIGEAQLASGQADAARQTFDSLLATGGNDDASLRAVAGLDQLDERAKTAPTEAERLRRARVYQFNRSFKEARQHWMALVNSYPKSLNRAEALFQLGRGFFLEDNFTDAIRWYERAHSEFPLTEEGEEGFYFAGHSYQAMFDADRAIQRYDAFLKAYPRSKYVPYAYLNAIDTLRSAKRLDEALRWTARAQSETQDRFGAARALFDQAKIRMTQGNFTGALADLNALRAQNLSARGLVAGTNAPELSFLRALSLEKLGRFDEAINEYLAMQPGRNDTWGYYGHQASERLRALGSNTGAKNIIERRTAEFLARARSASTANSQSDAKNAASQALRLIAETDLRTEEMRKILRAAYEAIPGYKLPSYSLATLGRTTETSATDAAGSSIADELLFLGLYDEAGPELVASRPAARGTASNWNYTIAYYCGFGDCAERTLRFAESVLKSIPDDYRLELLPRRLGELLYPLPFREQLERSAAKRGIDARLLLAIARQESRYDPEVKSFAAARGFLQFISSTAEQIAKQTGRTDFDQSDLYHAGTAIDIGAQYVRNLVDEFKIPQAVFAAYNGGEDSVRRWTARSQSQEVDRFVIEVAKRETRDYVFKVMNNYRAYLAIYPEFGV
jgi:peptidoglycan lytic transglycosylase